MKVLLSNKEENGTEHIIGFTSKDVIINERGDIKIPLSYNRLEQLEKDIKELKEKIKPVRGLRRNAGIIEEVCDMDKEDIKKVVDKFDNSNKYNIYLSQKERNVIRVQIENVLHNFEGYVNEHLSNNELQLAKADHNVVVTAGSILNKIQVADNEEPSTYDYYLTMDLSRDGDNKAILFKKYENSLKIEKFISFHEKDCTNMVHKFLKEIKGLNCAILIPSVAFGSLIIDYFKAEGFDNIIEINIKDINKAMNSDSSYIGSNKDELYTRILLYTTSKLGLKL